MPTAVQRKTVAKGTKLSIGPAGGALAYFGRIQTYTPPSQDRQIIEAPELDPQDDDGNPLEGDPVELGDEILGEFSFEMYWDPKHADAEQLDTWWANKTNLTFQLDSPHDTDGARMVYNGKIKTLSHAQLAKRDYYKRTVTVVRTSGITTAAIPA
ncbi:MAG TPA: hypothetical protein DDW52_15000 [Planctomycetaceae bacterium]|nr:hypothetical protein [Planctomycetaceae bacterium]